MPPVSALDQTPSSSAQESSTVVRFLSLRGVRWRIDLGVLPSSSSSIVDLRRVAADSRRRYANLRRRLIVDPHLSKDDINSDLVKDNPLSQSPDSIWSRYFRNAEVEKMLDQDLSRLYPDQESYFQTTICQTMLRRILLLWCLIHPECGYRQGMHEQLAPLLYVLHVDLQYLSHVRGQYEDHFNDEFQGVSLPETDLSANYRFEKIMNRNIGTDGDNSSQGKTAKVRSLDELDPETKDIFFMSDAYGAEGELGVILSEKFMEHDAYCMFDILMNDAHGVVAMAEFFSPSPSIGSSTGLPPIIEAASAIYQLLATVDSSLHSHLVELGVEPQYFAMRWLRVLFGREFPLEDLLIMWDKIFSYPNNKNFPHQANEVEFRCRILCSPRGAFILAMAVSVLLHLRSSLLATDFATACLQRLLNIPEDLNVKKLIEKAKSLQALALDLVFSSCSQGGTSRYNREGRRGHSLSYGSSPITPNQLSDSYWEEKWRSMYASEELKKGNSTTTTSSDKKKEAVARKLSLSRTGSVPCPMEIPNKNGGPSDEKTIVDSNTENDQSKYRCGIPSTSEVETESYFHGEQDDQNIKRKQSDIAGETCFSAENLSTMTSPLRMVNDHEYDSDESSVTSSSLVVDSYDEINHVEEPCSYIIDKEGITKCISESGHGSGREETDAAPLKQQKPLAGRFQLFQKSNRGGCQVHERMKDEDKDINETLRTIGKSMFDKIQIIELALKKDQIPENSGNSRSNADDLGQQQIAAFAALDELQKISNLLSEM
ncbi:TBC1 domain family member 5 homolog A-like [Zingiber officinale]|uniref:TBC1 domain family member 5 homolog A-like n=1 Tax=Zingiber officinale TaxID=94328 RepID=UPI001C4A97FB|nr:TBC1 domain family member 5 homolog A-like [Zingiber officinale]